MAISESAKKLISANPPSNTGGGLTDKQKNLIQANAPSNYVANQNAPRNYNPNAAIKTAPKSASNTGALAGDNDIGFFQRVANTLSGAFKSSTANYANAGATAYQGGQAGRTARNQELLEEYQYSLSREQKKLDDLIAANKRDPKTFTASDIESQQYIVDDWQRKVDALGGVVTNKVQEKATQEAYKAVDTLQESAQKDITTAKQGLGKVGQFVVDVGVGGTQLAGDIGAAMLLGGSTTLPMAARVFGSGAAEARRSGATYNQQVAYGAATALASALTERIANVAGPFKRFGKGFLDDALAKVTEKPMGKLVVSALSEGGEEMLESALQPLLQKLTYNPDAKYDADWFAETLYSGAIGAVLGGVGAGISPSTYSRANNVSRTNPLAPAQGNAPQATTDAPEINAPQIAENEPQTMPTQEAQKPAVEAPQSSVASKETHEIPADKRFVAWQMITNIIRQAKTENASALQTFYKENDEFNATSFNAEDLGRIIPEVKKLAQSLESYRKDAKTKELFDGYIKGLTNYYANAVYPSTDASQQQTDVPQRQGEELATTTDDGLGAANASWFEENKTDFDRLYEQSTSFYPRGENSRTDIYFEMPRKDFNGNRINKFANNVVGAQAISQDKVAITEQLAADGLLSTETKSNTETMAEAEAEIAKITKDGAMERLRNAAKRQETSPQIIAMLEAMLVDTKVDQNNNRFAELLLIGSEITKSTGRALQMLKYLRKMSPEYQLHAIEKRTEAYNERLKQERKPTKKQTEAAQKDAKTADEAVKTARKNAAESISKSFRSAKAKWNGKKVVIDSNQAGEPFVFEYAQKVGEAIANKISNRTPPKKKTFMEQIASQLNRFAKEKLPPTQKQKSLTPTELLRDYIQNADFYNQAWENAQVELRNKGVEDPALNEFMNTGINMDVDGNAKNTIFMQALVHAASQSGETRAMIEKQSALGVTNIAENIANKLIADTGATGEFAFTIREAAESYVNDVLRDGELDQEKFVNSAVNSAMRDIGQTFSALATKRENVKQSVKQQIVDVLSKKYGIGVADAEGIADIANEAFDRISREKTRQVLESRFKDRKPSVKKSVEQLFEEYANLGAFDADSPFNEQATRKVFHLDDEGYTITIPQELKDKFLAAKTEKQRNKVIGEIQQSIADQTPSTMVELINAIRYDNMLLTLRGPMKNTIGNAAMRLQAELSNSIAATIQRASGGKLEQTRSTFVSKALMDVGRADFAENKDVIVGDAKYSDGTGTSSSAFEQGVQKKRNVIQMPGTWGKSETDSKFSKGVRKTVDTILLLEKGRNLAVDSLLNNQYFGDTAFLRNAYARFLGGYLKAKGITAAQFESEAWRKANPDVVEKARNFATEQAREVTFRANRKLAEWVGKVARRPDTPWAVRVIGNGAAPFRKTLANIVINAEEYSPLGFVNATVQTLQKASGKDVTGNDIIDTLSKAVSGTVLFGLGVIMRNAGWLRGKEDDEEQKAFDDLTGAQEYAIYLPGGGNFTADWVSPTAIPVFMGAKFADVFDGNGFDWDDAAEIFFAFAEPLMELSMMQGLQDALDEVKYSDSNLLNLATNAALNYLAQGLTTPLGGQLERSTQENRQTTYIDKNSGVPANMQRKLGQASAKIPIWDYHQIDYVDAWGRVEKNIENPFLRTAYELASPAYIDKHELDDLEKELQRLYDLGITGVFPERAKNTLSFTTGEEGKTREITINLSADQYVKYAKTMGQNKFKYASAAKKSSAYGKMNAEEKGDYIKKMYEVAEFEAGKTIDARFGKNDDEMQGYANAKAAGIAPDQYYIFQQGANDAHGDDRQDQIIAIINGMKLTGKQKEYLITTKYKTRGHEIAKEQGWI